MAATGDYDVSILNARGIADERFEVEIVPFAKRSGRSTPSRVIWGAYRAAVAMNADLYHLHDPELLPVAFALETRGNKVVFDCHEDYMAKAKSREWIPKRFRSLVGRTYHQIANLIVPMLSGFVAAAPHIVDQFPCRQSVVLRNLPNVGEIKNGVKGLSKSPGVVLYTGGLTPHRGVEQVVSGLVEHCKTPWKLVILGRRDRGVERRLGSRLFDERISYLGELPFEELIQHMGTASVGVVCNQYCYDYQNALPNKLFEYMAAGLPVVCSDFSHWRAIVEGNRAGLVCQSGDARSIGGVLERVLANPDLGGAMGARGQAAIEAELCWEQEADKLFHFYDEILGTPNKAA